jgi:hypothetical protein
MIRCRQPTHAGPPKETKEQRRLICQSILFPTRYGAPLAAAIFIQCTATTDPQTEFRVPGRSLLPNLGRNHLAQPCCHLLIPALCARASRWLIGGRVAYAGLRCAVKSRHPIKPGTAPLFCRYPGQASRPD